MGQKDLLEAGSLASAAHSFIISKMGMIVVFIVKDWPMNLHMQTSTVKIGLSVLVIIGVQAFIGSSDLGFPSWVSGTRSWCWGVLGTEHLKTFR